MTSKGISTYILPFILILGVLVSAAFYFSYTKKSGKTVSPSIEAPAYDDVYKYLKAADAAYDDVKTAKATVDAADADAKAAWATWAAAYAAAKAAKSDAVLYAALTTFFAALAAFGFWNDKYLRIGFGAVAVACFLGACYKAYEYHNATTHAEAAWKAYNAAYTTYSAADTTYSAAHYAARAAKAAYDAAKPAADGWLLL